MSDAPTPSIQLTRDRALVHRILQGDSRGLKTFYEEYVPKLYRYAVRRLPAEHDVDDVVEATLAAAARRLETYRGEATLFTWLVQICRHEIGRHLAAQARSDVITTFLNDDVLKAVVEALEAPECEEPEAQALRQELVALVQVAVDQLPARYADALEWRYVLGLSSKEIAERMHIGDEAAQSLLARARRALREVCGEAFLANGTAAEGR